MTIEPAALRALATVPNASGAVKSIAGSIDEVARLTTARSPLISLHDAPAEQEFVTTVFTRLAGAVNDAEHAALRLSDGTPITTGLEHRLLAQRDKARTLFEAIDVASHTGARIDQHDAKLYSDLVHGLSPHGDEHRSLARAIARQGALEDALRGASVSDGVSMQQATTTVSRAVLEPTGTVPGLGDALERIATSSHPDARGALQYVGYDVGAGQSSGWRTLQHLDGLVRATVLEQAQGAARSRADEIIAAAGRAGLQ